MLLAPGDIAQLEKRADFDPKIAGAIPLCATIFKQCSLDGIRLYSRKPTTKMTDKLRNIHTVYPLRLWPCRTLQYTLVLWCAILDLWSTSKLCNIPSTLPRPWPCRTPHWALYSRVWSCTFRSKLFRLTQGLHNLKSIGRKAYDIYVQMYDKKERDLIRSHEKSPYTNGKFRNVKWQHKHTTKMFDYTVIADRPRTVSWRNYILPTDVIHQWTDPTIRLTSVQLKGNTYCK